MITNMDNLYHFGSDSSDYSSFKGSRVHNALRFASINPVRDRRSVKLKEPECAINTLFKPVLIFASLLSSHWSTH